jgi:predicted nucleotidyltransferase
MERQRLAYRPRMFGACLRIPRTGIAILDTGILGGSFVALFCPSGIDKRPGLADALFSKTQQKLLALIFGQPERSFFLNELIRLADVGAGSVQREIQKLENTGLVTVTRVGNQKHYRANPDSPIFAELHSLSIKILGPEGVLRQALQPLREKILLAVLFGSVAKREDTASSDVDLLIVSDELFLESLYAGLEPAEEQLNRKIHPLLLSRDEYHQRMERGDHLLERIFLGGAMLESGVREVYN